MNLLLYIHGKGGSAAESEHYTNLFPEYELLGLDYKTFTPWEHGKAYPRHDELGKVFRSFYFYLHL